MSMTEQTLFRSEVFTAQDDAWLGALHFAQPLSAWLIAGLALMVTAALIAFISVGTITKKARATGIIVPSSGSLTITAHNAGVLIHRHVEEGQQVHAGQTLFELSTERQGASGEITALVAQQLASRELSLATEQRLRINQDADKKRVLQERLQNLAAEATQLEHELILADRRQNLAQQSLHQFETLQQSGYVSLAQARQKQEELIDIDSRLSSLKRSKMQLQANQISLNSELTQLATTLASDLSQIKRAQASLQQEMLENQNRKTSFITAPQAGLITTITYQAGQAVSGGQSLATLIPVESISADSIISNKESSVSQLEAHLYLPSRTAGFVAVGQTVQIRYQAYPYQKFGLQKGKVTDVSTTPFAPNELPINLASTILSNAQQNMWGVNTNEALYRIKVQLNKQTIAAYGQEQFLKPGMTLEADVVQDSRKIWEWIVEPVLAVTQR
ncbi:HlyD family secretion protein [Solimicrobium silvestre]|uniref:HlyD family secretion protein n=1 Tax=Solimicrobium silvestre TaxID=2099400 RepID=A0A2S9H4L0_9BURK|nr:HlyD family efflux transporter periplasmic adaptor subunit [Solimicrobium silvestre]PRC94883.1 HlyD family secretion protein [Solimicrobium silvestre]